MWNYYGTITLLLLLPQLELFLLCQGLSSMNRSLLSMVAHRNKTQVFSCEVDCFNHDRCHINTRWKMWLSCELLSTLWWSRTARHMFLLEAIDRPKKAPVSCSNNASPVSLAQYFNRHGPFTKLRQNSETSLVPHHLECYIICIYSYETQHTNLYYESQDYQFLL